MYYIALIVLVLRIFIYLFNYCKFIFKMSKLFDNFSIGEATQQALKEAGEPEEVWQQQSQ